MITCTFCRPEWNIVEQRRPYDCFFSIHTRVDLLIHTIVNKKMFWFSASFLLRIPQFMEFGACYVKWLSYTCTALFGVLGYMALQFGFLARLTWWEYSWDIMEPVTYFVTYMTSMVCYGYFVLTRQV